MPIATTAGRTRGSSQAWPSALIRLALAALTLPVSSAAGAAAAEPAAGEPAVQGLRPKAGVDALVRAVTGAEPAGRLAALKRGAGVMRKDFKQAVLARLLNPAEDQQVRAAALELVIPNHI